MSFALSYLLDMSQVSVNLAVREEECPLIDAPPKIHLWDLHGKPLVVWDARAFCPCVLAIHVIMLIFQCSFLLYGWALSRWLPMATRGFPIYSRSNKVGRKQGPSQTMWPLYWEGPQTFAHTVHSASTKEGHESFIAGKSTVEAFVDWVEHHKVASATSFSYEHC